ncbi:endonuclease NucS domain-containing protein [Halocatena pleomorpha]|uniref:DUF91 domain-containing protein n=1 Tax=Halocatena pleomorpha TaxID=1785090 RepID=A0A3P3R5U1_9EURY|nr:endonuclease NucS domain-containing protein [Halocatena pleomorpha]RRJ28348.1 DUF91 domain-containing protein [Halocatena pleomorpha]
MTEWIRVYAGDCTAEYQGPVARTARGHVVVLVKPDGTVLVHDRSGYSPAVWLTRAASLAIDHDEHPRITAVDGEQRLTVRFHHLAGCSEYPVSVAGVPVGPSDTADGTGPYVRSRGPVVDIASGDQYALKRESTVIDQSCACGLPLIRIGRAETGDQLRCLDPGCGQSN